MTDPESHDSLPISLFFGVVHPQGGGWHLDEPVEMSFDDGEWAVFLQNSHFQALVCGALPSDLQTFSNEVISVVQGIADSLGFFLGASLTVELTGGFIPPAHLLKRHPRWPVLSQVGPASAVPAAILKPMVRVTIEHPVLRLALSDFSQAVARPDDTPFFCYRAVEGVRQFLAARDGVQHDASWEYLRATLNFSETELRDLAKASRARRHGELHALTETERLNSIFLAREVIARAVKSAGSETIGAVGPDEPKF